MNVLSELVPTKKFRPREHRVTAGECSRILAGGEVDLSSLGLAHSSVLVF
jgi:hypothetical protein